MSRQARPPALTGLTAYLLSQVAKGMKARLDDELGARGMRLRHMAVLAVLDDEESPSQLDLGRRLGLDPSDVTATVDDLVAAGFARRTVDRADRRRRLVAISAAGRRELARLVALAEGIADEMLVPLSPTSRRRLHADLTRVLAAQDAAASDRPT